MAQLLKRHILISALPFLLGCFGSVYNKLCPQDPPTELLQSFRIYNHYIAFLLVMIASDLAIKIAQQFTIPGVFFKELGNTDRGSHYLSDIKKQKRSLIKALLKTILSYTIIFIAYQTILFILSLTCLHTRINLNDFSPINIGKSSIEISPTPNRILTEDHSQIQLNEEEPSISMKEESTQPEKITLSMGNIKSVLRLNVDAIVLSKDQKIAFVCTSFDKALKIIDISDLKSPRIVASLSSTNQMIYRQRDIHALALSSDEKTIFVSNFIGLEIIDVTDLTSPKSFHFSAFALGSIALTKKVSNFARN